MGYDTRYSLLLRPADSELMARIWDSYDYDDHGFCFALNRNGDTADACKWYDWEDDMRVISAEHPDTEFHLHGEGREAGDIWDATFKAGKAHIRRAEIKIEPFDPSKLT